MENKLSDLIKLKEYLFNETFENIDDDLYPLIYENTDSVVWKVDGMKMYEFLSYSQIFENRIDFTLVRATCIDDVEAFFKFKTGIVVKSSDVKMSISSHKSDQHVTNRDH